MYRTALYDCCTKERLLTVLYYTVLLKIRKFAGREQIDRQTENREFKIRGHSNPQWIVGGAGQ